MLPHLEATPCPTSASSYDYLNILPDRLGDNLGYGDNTSNVDFTKDLQATLRAAGPKRRATAVRPRRPGKSMNFAIHSDEGQQIAQHNSNDAKHTSSQAYRPSVLAQPAQRPRPVVNSELGNVQNAPNKNATLTGKSHQNESLNSTDLASHSAHGKTMARDFPSTDKSIKRPARRGTIYIPPEDTTMPTVWMGVFSPIKDLQSLNKDSLDGAAAEITGIMAQMAKKRIPRKSTVTAIPRREPLQQALRPPQETTTDEEIPGRPTGKENLPPGHQPTGNGKVKEPFGICAQPRQQVARQSMGLGKRARLACNGGVIASSRGSLSPISGAPGGIHKHQVQPAQKASVRDVETKFARLRVSGGKAGDCQSGLSSEVLKLKPQPSSHVKLEKVPGKILVPIVTQPVVDQGYPLLSEDVQNPSLYESNWLAHQEIAITQLINNLFDAVKGSTDAHDVHATRQQLLRIYQDQSMVLLQKRLQASLLYGSLSIPKGASANSKLSEDLGMKQKFLNLWLDTYDHQTLQACAEVVIGRECSSSPRNSPTSNCPPSKKTSKQKLSRYLETFLIRNEDVIFDNATLPPGTTGLQHTLLRSLMLIILLDKAKTLSQTPFPNCLFQPTSSHKSSESVIQTLAQMLLPSAGNILRSLSHIDYFVSHVQYPLEEYDYQISNLAVDLRDGVRLTRLFELLLYPSASNLLSPHADTATTTITMPTGQVLSLLQGEPEHDWPLSQHLKFPCLGRATKLYNVQIALSALSSIKGVSKIVTDIKAEHIVDGFREKTVALLWGLASKWGLGSLIDWTDLKHEIRRLGGIIHQEEDDDEETEEEDDFTRHKSLLKEWAAAAAALKGLEVKNLTTSFADGRVFEAIVDQYERYLPTTATTTKTSNNRHLSQRLAELGCSLQFGNPPPRAEPHHQQTSSSLPIANP